MSTSFPTFSQAKSYFESAWDEHYGTTPPTLSRDNSTISNMTYRKWILIGEDGVGYAYWTTATNGVQFIE